MSELKNLMRPPELNKRVICISDDYLFSAQISCCFNRENTYFAVLEAPKTLKEYWRNEFIKLNNVIARIQPQIIIFSKVNSKIVDEIKKQLRINENKYLYIDDQLSLDKFIAGYKSSFKGVLKCPSDKVKVANALLDAKRNRCQLVIDDKADFKINTDVTKSHLVVSDSSDDLLPVILANYAYSINADICFFECALPYSPEEMFSILKDTRGSGKRKIVAQSTVDDIKSTISLEIKNIDKYKFITFFTEEFFYGYLFPQIPSTHIYSKVLPSHYLATAIAYPFIQIKSAILVDPGFFKDSETDAIKSFLINKEVVVKELRDDKFSNFDLDNCVQFYPYDFLFFCSHGGFADGTMFKIKFLDKNKCDHIIVVNILDSFIPTNRGEGKDRIIEVKTFTEFVELDGQLWYEKKYKTGSSKTVVEDFLAIKREDWDVVESKKARMKFCNIIATKDKLGPYFPMIHGISDPKSTPFIFNNACISTYTMAVDFIYAGSGFYIGTVKPVGIIPAIDVAKDFFDKTINQNKTLALSLWESQYNSKIAIEDAVYTCIGCHFLKFSFVLNGKNIGDLKARIKLSAQMRVGRVDRESLSKSVQDRHEEAVKFLHQEFVKLS